MTRAPMRSPARDAIMREHWPAGTDWEELAELINALPGSKVNQAMLQKYACKLEIKRPSGMAQAAANKRWHGVFAVTEAPPKPEPVPVRERGKPGVALPPVSRPWEEIRVLAWMDSFMLRNMHDLPGYNRARIARGYAPLCISEAENWSGKWTIRTFS